MMPTGDLRRQILTWAFLLAWTVGLPAAAPAGEASGRPRPTLPPRNICGAHLLVDRATGNDLEQLRWVRHLVGRWGHAKTLFMGITAQTANAPTHWQEFVATCYKMELVPVIRLAGVYRDGGWVKPAADKPGDYTSMAQAVRRVVSGLPRDARCPLYVEIWNEPNLPVEWSGAPSAAEYAKFFVQTSAAIRSIGDPRIVILNGALAPNPDFLEALCKADAGFVNAFDVWVSHPYPGNRPPEMNLQSGLVRVSPDQTIDAYRRETDVLARYGRRSVKVMITETGWDLGNNSFTESERHPIVNEAVRADYVTRAFRDHWEKWPEILAVLPFVFAGKGWERFEWVFPDSGTNADGSPTRPRPQYNALAWLAKSTDATGAISGRAVLAGYGIPVPKVQVRLAGSSQSVETTAAGCYWIPRLPPGSHGLRFSAEGFRTRTLMAGVVAGSNTVVDVEMTADGAGRLRLRIEDGLTHQPLDGVNLSLDPPTSGPFRSTSSGEVGPIELLPVGYSLAFARQGYAPLRLPAVSVGPRRSATMTVPLGPQRSPDWPNRLGNASFEDGGGGGGMDGVGLRYEPRTSGAFRVAEGEAISGWRSQAIGAGKEPTTIWQITDYNTARPGRRHVAGVWARTEKLTGEGARLTLSFTRNDGSSIHEIAAPRLLRGGDTAWTWLEVSDVCPAGAERVAVNLQVRTGAGTVYFDDVYLGIEP